MAEASSFSFAVFGDNQGNDKTFATLISRVNQDKSLKLAINTGDLIERGREAEYQHYLKLATTLKPKLYHAPGNHDLVNKGYKYFRKYIGPLYYSFNYQNAHFVVLNNAFTGSFTKQQLAWLKKDLAKTRQKNIFVFMHRPMFDPLEIFSGYMMSGQQVVKELQRIFKYYGVDYVFAGHIHAYAKVKRDGIVYLVSGGAGGQFHLPPELGGFYHYIKITVEGEQIKDEVVRIYG